MIERTGRIRSFRRSMKETMIKTMENVGKIIVIYPGRFQPPHPGHHAVYEYCANLFGRENIFLATSNRQGKKSPFDFHTKKFLWSALFGVPDEKIIQCRNPAYYPEEILSKFPGHTAVLAVSEKDASKRYEKYMKRFFHDMEGLNSWEKETYYMPVPIFHDGLSATKIRNMLETDDMKELERIYGNRCEILKNAWNRIVGLS